MITRGTRLSGSSIIIHCYTLLSSCVFVYIIIHQYIVCIIIIHCYSLVCIHVLLYMCTLVHVLLYIIHPVYLRHEKVQENCIDLVGRIADRGSEYVSAREWMRICFELLELLKAHKKAIRRATVNTFGYSFSCFPKA